MICKRVFVLNPVVLKIKIFVAVLDQIRLAPVGLVQYAGQFNLAFGGQRHIVKRKICFIPESYDYDSFPVLRYPALAVYYLVIAGVAQILRKGFPDDLKGMAFVMGFQILDILKDECLWLFLFDYPRHVKEQRSLCLVLKTRRPPQGLLFRDPSN